MNIFVILIHLEKIMKKDKQSQDERRKMEEQRKHGGSLNTPREGNENKSSGKSKTFGKK
jgi:hypothetical protein